MHCTRTTIKVVVGNVISWFKCAHSRSVDMNSERFYFGVPSIILIFSH